MREQFEKLVSELRAAEGDNLLSVVVYGSALAAPEQARRSDFQWLLMTRRLGAPDLRRIRPVIRSLRAAGYSMPVFFTEQEFLDSLDVFPIEFRQMKRAYQVIYGIDPLATNLASSANLRQQIEYELRGKLLRLRSLYLPAGEKVEDLTGLMTESVVSFVQIMRPILELLGEDPPVERMLAAKRVGERLGVDMTPIVRLLKLREESRRLMEVETEDLFAAYLECLGGVIDAVDKIGA